MLKIILIIAVLSTACSSAEKPLPNPEPVETNRKVTLVEKNIAENLPGQQITSLGVNEQASFSEQGDRIVYVSAHRRAHTSYQIYEYLIHQGIERRVTYSDGDTERPIYLESQNLIAYSSTTDELKEFPELFYPRATTDPIPNDLYFSDPFGDKIIRLTQMPGNQSHPALIPDSKNEIVYLSLLPEDSSILKLNFRTDAKAVLHQSKKTRIKTPIALKNGPLFWIESDPIAKTSSIFLKRKPVDAPERLALPEAVYSDLSWYDHEKKQVLFLQQDKKVWTVQIYDFLNNCISKIFESKTEIGNPKVHLKSKKLLLTAPVEQKRQLFLTSLPTASECVALK